MYIRVWFWWLCQWMFGGAHSKCTEKIVMWFFKWNIALVGFRLFTSRRLSCCCCSRSFARNAFATLCFFRGAFSLLHCAVSTNRLSIEQKQCHLLHSLALTANAHTLQSMQMFTYGGQSCIYGKCVKPRKTERESSLTVHWFTPIINEADGTHSQFFVSILILIRIRIRICHFSSLNARVRKYASIDIQIHTNTHGEKMYLPFSWLMLYLFVCRCILDWISNNEYFHRNRTCENAWQSKRESEKNKQSRLK